MEEDEISTEYFMPRRRTATEETLDIGDEDSTPSRQTLGQQQQQRRQESVQREVEREPRSRERERERSRGHETPQRSRQQQQL